VLAFRRRLERRRTVGVVRSGETRP